MRKWLMSAIVLCCLFANSPVGAQTRQDVVVVEEELKIPPGYAPVTGANTEQVRPGPLVAAAYIAFLAGFFTYALWLARRQTQLSREIETLRTSERR